MGGDWLGTGFIAHQKRKYLSFEEARDFAQKLGLMGKADWFHYAQSGKNPDHIPTDPYQRYKNKGWISWGDWLCTGTVAPFLRKYRQFEEAREFVHKLNLKNENEWRQYCQSGKKPEDIPADPYRAYKDKGWKGLGDWLGTGTIATFLRTYLPFKEARDFVHKLNLKNRNEWEKFCKSGDKPEDIPADPYRTYKNKGWKGLGDWLGTGTIATFLRDYLSYEEARDFVHKLNLKSQSEWKEYSRSGEMPKNIPIAPHRTYNKKGWKGYGDWLGTGTVATHLRTYLPFKEARDFVHKLEIESANGWRLYVKSNEKPYNIPYWPDKIYKNRGWSNWGDWLGTSNIAPQLRNYLPYEKAKKLVHKLKLKSNAEWIQYINSGEKPDNIPAAPQHHYKGQGWKNWGDWLGTGFIAHQHRTYLSYEEARELVHKLNLKSYNEWLTYRKSDKMPENIPTNPNIRYKNKGWKGYGDWLGTGTIATRKRIYRKFEDARAFVRSLKLRNREQWLIYCRSGKKPEDIPNNPNQTYKNQGWKGMTDWLGKNS